MTERERDRETERQRESKRDREELVRELGRKMMAKRETMIVRKPMKIFLQAVFYCVMLYCIILYNTV